MAELEAEHTNDDKGREADQRAEHVTLLEFIDALEKGLVRKRRTRRGHRKGVRGYN